MPVDRLADKPIVEAVGEDTAILITQSEETENNGKVNVLKRAILQTLIRQIINEEWEAAKHSHTGEEINIDVPLYDDTGQPTGDTYVEKLTNILETLQEEKADKSYVEAHVNLAYDSLDADKADRIFIKTIPKEDMDNGEFIFGFSACNHVEARLEAVSAVSIIFENSEYSEDYISGLSFNSGETPTAFDYTNSGIINWVGTDCSKDGELSIFQPSANTHYDIVFYFNGVQFIGLVNGFVPAAGNEAV